MPGAKKAACGCRSNRIEHKAMEDGGSFQESSEDRDERWSEPFFFNVHFGQAGDEDEVDDILDDYEAGAFDLCALEQH